MARVVLLAAKVKSEDGDDKRILARGKSNIGPDSGGFEYHIAQVEALPGIQASRIEWGRMVEGTAQELLTDPSEGDQGSASDTSDAAQMLQAELTADTWTNMETATEPLRKAGFTKKQIWSASKKLGVMRKKGGMQDGWYWKLRGDATAFTFIDPEGSTTPKNAEDSAEDSEHSTFKTLEPSESSGEMESSVEVFHPDKTGVELLPRPTKNGAGQWSIPPGDVSDVEVM